MKIVYIDSNDKVLNTTSAFFELAGFTSFMSFSSFQDSTNYLGICNAFVIGNVYDENKNEIVEIFNEINPNAYVISYANTSGSFSMNASFVGSNHKGLVTYLKNLKKEEVVNNAILLLSGGMDSVTLLYRLLNNRVSPFCMIVDYKQSHRKEVNVAVNLCKEIGVDYQVVQIDLTQIGGSRLTGDDGKSLSGVDVVVPGRNTLFITLAAALAKIKGIQDIYLAPNQSDWAVFPDCRPDFYGTMERTLKIGIDENLRIQTPYLRQTKTDIVKEGLQLKVPYEKTWSCYTGKKNPCGKCGACAERAKAFAENGVKDPLNG